jgi:hypothetical protein
MRSQVAFAVLTLMATTARAQHSSRIGDEALEAIIAETSGALALAHGRNLLSYSGFAPSLGSEQTADYVTARAREFGLEDVRIEAFPLTGNS